MLIKRKEIQGGRPYAEEGKDWSHAAVSQGVLGI
jgi:hypothetical protein